MAWYNVYRPSTFEDVVGQTLVKSVLQNSIKNNKIKHGYLLSGPKGTGKTTLARIFANQVNDINSHPEARLDIIELDAASNTGVDSIRQLIDTAQTPPMAGKYKVFIIDEVHMLSKSAMNALLKILEEPPVYLIFLLATTNPEKLLPTVLSRLTKLTLSGHTVEDISNRLEFVARSENMIIDQESRDLIAKRSGGGQRDAINLLETLYSYNLDKYDLSSTTSLLGLLPNQSLINISKALLNQDQNSIKTNLESVQNSGIDGESFLGQLLELLLEESFGDNNELDSLILPVASVLNLKLPINTVTASVALLHAQIKQNNLPKQNFKIEQLSPDFLQKKNSNPNQSLTKTSDQTLTQEHREHEEEEKEPKISLDVEISTSISPTIIIEQEPNLEVLTQIPSKVDSAKIEITQLDNNQNPSSDQNTNHQTSDIISSNSSKDIAKLDTIPKAISAESVEQLFSRLKDDKECPAILKLIIAEIRVKSITNYTINCTLSSTLFLQQAKSQKTQDFIIQKINITFGNEDYGLTFELRKASDSIAISFDQPDTNNSKSSTRQDPKNTVPSTQESQPNSTNNQEFATSINPEEKIFYSVYGGLPEDTVGDSSNITIIRDPIPIPIKNPILDNQKTDWDNDVGSMFDFD